MNSAPRVLVVDDQISLVETIQILLRRADFEVDTAHHGRAALEKIEAFRPDVVLSDIRMHGMSGIDLLKEIRKHSPDLPVILMTAEASLQSAIEAVNQGAFHYVQKPFSNDELLGLIREASQQTLPQQDAASDSDTPAVASATSRSIAARKTAPPAAQPIGKSTAFSHVRRLADKVAPTESTVLLSGESGSGKEVMARYIHQRSERSEQTMLSINCGALTETLLESELFGHTKGSFTGATSDKEGLFVAARGGTFFLDEVTEMSPGTQVKLLRVLQEREVLPVGSTTPIPIDVRVIAATNRKLEDEVRHGRFRADLFYRLNVFEIKLPSLRERGDDVLLLAEHALEQLAEEHGRPLRLEMDAREHLRIYPWPGNVRELQNALERAALLSSDGHITAADLPDLSSERLLRDETTETRPANPPLAIIERSYIDWVLRSEGGNKSRAAETLGIDPSTLYRKLKQYEDEDAAQSR